MIDIFLDFLETRAWMIISLGLVAVVFRSLRGSPWTRLAVLLAGSCHLLVECVERRLPPLV